MKGSLDRLKFELRLRLKRSARVYVPLSRWRHGQTLGVTPQDLVHPQAVRKDTDLVVEAPEGSGNTFSVLALQAAQPAPLAVAHHLHAPAQIAAASRWGIPTLVVLRHPRDVCVSRVLRHSVSLRDALREYCSFYEETSRRRGNVVVARFESVTSDYGAVIEAVNRRFQTSFVPFTHSRESVERIFADIDARYASQYGDLGASGTARPTDTREASKATLGDEYGADSLRSLRVRAERLYEKLAQTADA